MHETLGNMIVVFGLLLQYFSVSRIILGFLNGTNKGLCYIHH
jgi:hypothetical protein